MEGISKIIKKIWYTNIVRVGPYGPKRYDFVWKIINFDENHKIANKIIKT